MREILFRGKALDNGEFLKCRGKWVSGGITFAMSDRTPYICPARFSDYDEEIEVDANTVSEFTGLYDKNGNAIFEGDILLYKTWFQEKILCVIFKDGAFGTQNPYDGCHYEFMAFSDTEYPYQLERELEVVGNKWDNKELLKGE